MSKRYPSARFVAAELRDLDLSQSSHVVTKAPKCHLVGTQLTDLNQPCRYGETDCPICQEPLNDGRPQDELVCGHRFHHECIGRWFAPGRYTCPVCRTTASDEDLQAHGIALVFAPNNPNMANLAAHYGFPPGTVLPDDFDELLDFDFRDRISRPNDPYSGWPSVRGLNQQQQPQPPPQQI